MDNVTIVVVGNLTDDPELRFTASGKAVANFRVASSRRSLNKTTGEWEDDDTVFLPVVVWGEQAENAVDIINRGSKVIITGRLTQRSYETREGEKRTVVEVVADELGPAIARRKKSE